MPIVWRISNYADLSGEGGRLFAGRWHSGGEPIVYCATSVAGALLELLVHFNKRQIPETYQLLEIYVPKTTLTQINNVDLSLQDSQELGDNWLKNKQTLLLEVNSIITPHTKNMLLNPLQPLHPLFCEVKLVSTMRYPLDKRLVI